MQGIGSQLGYAAAWRMVLDDAHWKDYRARLKAGQGPHGPIAEHVLAQVETEEFNRYRADAQSRFKLTSDELLAELDRRIAADRETRVQGAEDKTLNEGKKILLAITFSADAGTSSNAASLEEKRRILRRCLESAHASGADERALFLVLPFDANPLALVAQRDEGDRVIRVGENPGLPLGETRMVRAAIADAKARGFEWIVKICGDVFHPHMDWAQEMVRRAMASPNGAALVDGNLQQPLHGHEGLCRADGFPRAHVAGGIRSRPARRRRGPRAHLDGEDRQRLGLTKLWLPLPCRQRHRRQSKLVDADRSGVELLRAHAPGRRRGECRWSGFEREKP